MAQVCGDTLYDFDWDSLRENILPRLRVAADRWATYGLSADDPDRVAALLIRMFARDAHNHAVLQKGWWSAESQIQTLDQEIQHFPRKLILQDLRDVTAELSETVHAAAQAWSEGDPESPATEDVLNWIVAVLFNYRLVRRPPKPRCSRHSIFA